MSAERIEALLESIDRTPWGAEERALVDEALALALVEGDEPLEYRVRLRLNASANMSGDSDALLSSFAWCLAKHDADPVRFPAQPDGEGGVDLLWHFKWMAGTLSASPLFGTEQIRAVLDDMQAHYERAGAGPSGVAMARFDAAVANGWRDEAAEAYRVLTTTPRDEYSHCDACVRSATADYLVETGREAEAIVLYEELVDGGFTCGEEPERALADSLIAYLRAGELDRAKAFHLRSYRDARGNADNVGIIAKHVRFCAITGNEARGLAILERHLGWLAHDPLNRRGHFALLGAAGVLLDAVVRSGHGATPVRGADAEELAEFFGAHEGSWTAAELSVASWAAAASIADAFDARNGNRHLAERLAELRELADEHYGVPLAAEGFAPAAPVEAPEPATSAEWLERTSERFALGDLDGALVSATSGLEAGDGDAAVRAELLGARVSALVGLDRRDEAVAALPERIAALGAAGRESAAALEERLGLVLHGAAGPADLDVLESELAAAEAAATAPEAADLAVTLAHARLAAEDREGAAAAIEVAYALAGSLPADDRLRIASALLAANLRAAADARESAVEALDRVLVPGADRVTRGDAHRLRARLHAGDGDFDAAILDADAALDLDYALADRARILDDCVLAAAILDDLGRPDEAVSRYRLAVQQAELAEAPGLLGLRYGLGRQLVRAGHADESIELLQSVYDEETATEAPVVARAETLQLLGSAFRDTGEYGSAAGAWFTAADLFEEGEAKAGAVTTLLDLARLHVGLDYRDEGIELLERAVALVEGDQEYIGSYVDARHLLGQTRGGAGDERALADFDVVADLAREHEADYLLADVTDSRARALGALGRIDEAVATALGAADLFEEAGATIPAGSATLVAADALQGAERHDEAVVLYGAAIERLVDHPGATATARLRLADSLEALGRAADAATERRLAED
ncbi:hypothetical protein [Agromyces seonyuensis]|uniref:Tetratricopeptide repeat protein n=1 Tax=Agromyces seonyuensis TaxID=2662446 RepID=A0A6I4NYW3_9MICO|nr:hypothetical protein [Agromyces seonyuensis]MWB99533.1 hypothetical protein [Agromyces seonyuensis]